MTMERGWSDPYLPEADPDAIAPQPRRAARGRLAGLDADQRRRMEAAALALSPSPDGPAGPHASALAGRNRRGLTLTMGPMRFLRQRADLTQQVLADLAGVSVSAISRMERGLTVPSLGTIILIARALGQADPAGIMTAAQAEAQAGALWQSR